MKNQEGDLVDREPHFASIGSEKRRKVERLPRRKKASPGETGQKGTPRNLSRPRAKEFSYSYSL